MFASELLSCSLEPSVSVCVNRQEKQTESFFDHLFNQSAFCFFPCGCFMVESDVPPPNLKYDVFGRTAEQQRKHLNLLLKSTENSLLY